MIQIVDTLRYLVLGFNDPRCIVQLLRFSRDTSGASRVIDGRHGTSPLALALVQTSVRASLDAFNLLELDGVQRQLRTVEVRDGRNSKGHESVNR